jgi:hypothetical protein
MEEAIQAVLAIEPSGAEVFRVAYEGGSYLVIPIMSFS